VEPSSITSNSAGTNVCLKIERSVNATKDA
jgi:hypothetical protein